MSKSKVPEKAPLVLNRLAIVIKEEQWNNKTLAEKIGYDETTISLWTNNHVQPPITTFARIALLMNRNLQDFFVNTLNVDKSKKDIYLKQLTEIAARSKRTGKNKVVKPKKKTK